MKKEYQQSCSGCQKTLTTDDFLHDPNLPVIGIAHKCINGKKAYYFFNHDTHDCGTTILVEADKLISAYDQTDNKPLTDSCRCGENIGISLKKINTCDYKCDLEPYRDLLKEMSKNKKVQPSRKSSGR